MKKELKRADRAIEVTLREAEDPGAPVLKTVDLYQSSHALVIGINRYTHGWPVLSGAVPDAELVAQALEEKGFSVVLKKDLNSSQLKTVFNDFFIDKGANPQARLFVRHPKTNGGFVKKRCP